METKIPQRTVTFKGDEGLRVFSELLWKKKHEHLNVSAFTVEALSEKLAREDR